MPLVGVLGQGVDTLVLVCTGCWESWRTVMVHNGGMTQGAEPVYLSWTSEESTVVGGDMSSDKARDRNPGVRIQWGDAVNRIFPRHLEARLTRRSLVVKHGLQCSETQCYLIATDRATRYMR